ncbi:MAG: GNAT family N-acetyltransferase, partial [Duganella sp.]
GEIANPSMCTLVCEQHGQLMAFAQLRWGKLLPGVAAASAGEILRFYVARGWHGQGIAQALMAACLEAVAQRGSDVVWLGVWERNARALAFYRKFGFEPVGEHTFMVGSDPQRDVIMARRMDALRHASPA